MENSNTIPTTVNNDLFIVDIDGAEQKDLFNFSSFFKCVTCIPLDNNKNAQIGRVSKFIAFGDHFYVLDSDIAKSLFVFERNGKFIRNIGSRGQGPSEYIIIRDFTIDIEKNEIFLLDSPGRIHIFYLDGTYSRSVKLPRDSLSIVTFQYFNELLYAQVYPPFEKKDDDCLLQTINIDDGSKINRFLKPDQYNKGWNGPLKVLGSYFIPKLDPPYLFRHLFMDTIFAITDKGLSPYLAFNSKDMPTDKDIILPPDLLKQPIKHVDLISGLIGKNKIYSIINYWETSEFFNFQLLKGSSVQSIFFNKKTRTAQKTSEFRNDLVYKEEQPFKPFRFYFYDQNGVYEIIEEKNLFSLLSFINENKVKSPFYEQFKKLNTDSNPVILYYEFK